jgi:hypothetical protein
MMGRFNHDQGELFYSFCLEKVVPDDHLVRKIAAFLDLAWVRVELAPYYSSTGRPPAQEIRADVERDLTPLADETDGPSGRTAQ